MNLNEFITELNGRTILTISIEEDVLVSTKQINSFNQYNESGFNGFKLQYSVKSGLQYFQCDITGFISLKSYIENNEVNYRDLISILENYYKIISNCKFTNVRIENFPINEKYIFINKHTFEVKLIYLPFYFLNNIRVITFKELIKTILIGNSHIDSRNIMFETEVEKLFKFYDDEISILRNAKEIEKNIIVNAKIIQKDLAVNKTEFLNFDIDKTEFLFDDIDSVRKKLKIQINCPNSENITEVIDKFPIIFGRENNPNIYKINENSVSRKHIKIELFDCDLFLSDSGSSNGVKVNNMNLEKNERHKLLINDEIKLGRVIIKILDIN